MRLHGVVVGAISFWRVQESERSANDNNIMPIFSSSVRLLRNLVTCGRDKTTGNTVSLFILTNGANKAREVGLRRNGMASLSYCKFDPAAESAGARER